MNKYIKATNTEGQRIARKACDYYLNNHIWNEAFDIWEAYKNPSFAKVKAWNYCKELCKRLHGYDLKIIGHNCFSFSVVFRFKERGTGRECYAYITKDYNRFCYAD